MSDEVLPIESPQLNSAYKTEMTAEEAVEMCLTEFGTYSLQSKIANIVDGLKPVQRRILLVHRTSETPKVITVAGKVLEQYHPHGDGAISETITRMAQPFNVAVVLMSSDSNVGTYGGGNAAAPRYLKVSASKLSQHVYFKNIDFEIFEYMPTEVGDGKLEPKYLVPKIPMALIVSGFGIGLGHRSVPANLCLGDVCNMAIEYIKMLKTHDTTLSKADYYRKLAKYMVPDFPIVQMIRNHDQVVEHYKAGDMKQSLVLDGTMTLTPTGIRITTLPFLVKPEGVWMDIGAALNSKKPNFINTNFTRVSKHNKNLLDCKVEVVLKRGVNVFDVLEEFKTFIQFTRKWTPSYVFTNRSFNVVYADPLIVMEHWYQARTRAIKAELSSGQHRLVSKIRLLEAQIKIGDNQKEALMLVTDSNDVDDAVPKLCERYGLTKTQSYAFFKNAKVQDFLRKGHQDLVQMLKDTIAELNLLQRKFIETDVAIAEDCDDTVARFPEYRYRNANPPNFIGAVVLHGGVIQFETKVEMFDIIKNFDDCEQIVIYPKRIKWKLGFTRDGVLTENQMELPKEFAGSGISAGEASCKYTVVLSNEGTIFCIKAIDHPLMDNSRFFYLGETGVAIHADGRVVEFIPGTTIPSRKSIDSQGVKTDILCVGNTAKKEIVIAYSDQKNVVQIRKVEIGERLILQPKSMTKTYVHAMVGHGDQLVFTVPENWVNKCSTRHIIIEDTSFITKKGIELKLHGGAKELPHGKKIGTVMYSHT